MGKGQTFGRDDNIEGRLADIVSRLGRLESQQPARPSITSQPASGLVFFPRPIPLVYVSPASSTNYADSGSARFLPPSAKVALVFAAVEDTTGGVGRTVLWGRGGGSEVVLASLFETLAGTADSSGSQSFAPVTGGRFDWRVDLTAGANAVNVRIELLGYME